MTTDSTTSPLVAAAGVPSRATGSLTLGFGLVSIPVAVYAGTQDGGIQRHEFTALGDAEGGVVEYVKVGRQCTYADPTTGEVKAVDYSRIVKMYETQSGAQVTLSDAEIATAIGEANGSGKILSFQPLGNLGAYVTESLMQVRPAKRGSGRDKSVDPVAERAFGLLMGVMASEGVFALVRYVMRGKVRFAALTADGTMRSLRFASEVRTALPMPEVELTDAEKAAAKMLLGSIRTNEVTALTDDASERVDAYASSKATTGHAAVEAPEAPVHGDFKALMEALAKSVAAATAPVTEVA